MIILQYLLVAMGFGIGAILIIGILAYFERKDIAVYFLAPLFLYCLGFALRLSRNAALIDVGYFFTEIPFLIIYTLFSGTLLLGQLKYWKR